MKFKSTSGLLVHKIGKIAFAFIYLIFLTKNQNQQLICTNKYKTR